MVALSLLIGVMILREATEFDQIKKSNYQTPWYSNSWLEMPYTNFKLSGMPVREYWTTNAMGSERWLVREVEFDGKIYWTTLERLPIERV